jgi:hypothetical protein
LIPGESINDDGLFIDSMSLDLLVGTAPVEVRPSRDFADVLRETVAV